MAQRDDEKKKDEISDSGLGNLPPLSDFESGSGLTSDSGLPPLGKFSDQEGGLPPISEINVETPRPTGGNVRPTPPGFEAFTPGPSPFETPPKGSQPRGAAFQDLAADSDFSPETPEIGPGPDLNIDTPMFDSAFGARGFDQSVSTPAPTQAMETPMFGVAAPPSGGGAEQNAFGGAFGGFDFTGGTPAPDFSPDSELRQAAPPVQAPPAAKAAKGGGSPLIAVGVGVVLFIVGIVVSPFLADYLSFLPNPTRDALQKAQADNQRLTQQMQELTRPKGGDKPALTLEQVEELNRRSKELDEQITQKKAQLDEVTAQLEKVQSDLRQVQDDLSAKNEEFVTVQQAFEDLQNQTAIIQARQKGLIAEVERLTNLVGELEEANARSQSIKQSLAHNVDKLLVQVKESLPLTPEKFSHAARVAAIENLRDTIAQAKYVTPDMFDAYTSLYLRELQISSAQEYFFAKIPVRDRFGTPENKWAECLMKGTWGVLYRTLDGKNIGIYQNAGTEGAALWKFREDLPGEVKKQVEAEILANRIPDFEQRVAALAAKQNAAQTETPWQRAYSSL